MNLAELAKKYPTDKCAEDHDYLRTYERYFRDLDREAVGGVLEIGVGRGGSLRIWRDYFPNARIVGIDWDPNCARHEDDRIAIVSGNQASPEICDEIATVFGRPIIIIDDGSHKWDDTIASFELYFPLLAPGGLYFIEDLHCSYHEEFMGSGHTRTVDYLKNLVDLVNLYGKYTWAKNRNIEARQYRHEGGRSFAHEVEWIHFYPSLCVLKKLT